VSADVGRQPFAVAAAVDLHLPFQSGGEEAGRELVGHGHAGGCIDHKHLQQTACLEIPKGQGQAAQWTHKGGRWKWEQRRCFRQEGTCELAGRKLIWKSEKNARGGGLGGG